MSRCEPGMHKIVIAQDGHICEKCGLPFDEEGRAIECEPQINNEIKDCTNLKIKEIPKSPDVEYDQGDKVVVYYDDLYNLIEENKELKKEKVNDAVQTGIRMAQATAIISNLKGHMSSKFSSLKEEIKELKQHKTTANYLHKEQNELIKKQMEENEDLKKNYDDYVDLAVMMENQLKEENKKLKELIVIQKNTTVDEVMERIKEKENEYHCHNCERGIKAYERCAPTDKALKENTPYCYECAVKFADKDHFGDIKG